MTTKKENQTKKEAILLVGNSEQDANMYSATKFLAPDSFAYIETDKKKILITSTLEVDRAKEQADVDEVINFETYGKNASITKTIPLILKDLKVNTVVVPNNFSYKLGKILEDKKFCVEIKDEPFFKQRMVKNKQEIKHIIEVQRVIENVLKKTLDIIKKSEIKNNLLYYADKPLTSEYLRNFFRVELLKKNCWCEADVIVSCGKQTSMPHNLGTGQLTANSPIIMDIFPRSLETRYWADMTRTVVKGKASDEFKKLYYTVLEAQKMAIEMIKPGIDGFNIHKTVENYFESKGYKTEKIDGQMQGFIHGTGHGVGLDIHEYPQVNRNHWILEERNIITIEPGLYYKKIGGVRIEDLLVVTENGYRNLTKSPKEELIEL